MVANSHPLMVVCTTATFPRLHHHQFHHLHRLPETNNLPASKTRVKGRWRRRWVLQSSSSSPLPSKNPSVGELQVADPVPETPPSAGDSSSSLNTTSNVVRRFYGGINARDVASVEGLIADNCVYEDLVFPQPFVGRKAILDFFGKFMSSISTDLQFAIDDISEEDTTAVGVTWHLEWKGKPFPFSKGCSFYRLEVVNGQRKIIYGRDIVEPAIKPGDKVLVVIKGVTWLLQQFPQLADQF